MKIDDTEVPEAVIGCWKDLLAKSGDADLPVLSKKHKELSVGFDRAKRQLANLLTLARPHHRIGPIGWKSSDSSSPMAALFSRTMMLAELSDALRVPHYAVAARE